MVLFNTSSTVAEQSRSVRMHLPMLFRLTAVLPLLLVVIEYGYGVQRIAAPGWVVYTFWTLVALMTGSIWLQWWFGLRLTTTHAEVHNLRRRSVRWADVQAITQEQYFGSLRVVLWTTDRQRIALRAPVTVLGRLGLKAYERDFHLIGQWWLAHRGPQWRPLW